MRRGFLGNNQGGISVVEVLIGSAIVVALVITVASALQSFVWLSALTTGRVQAGVLLEETEEALQIMRDQGWSAYIEPMIIGDTYYLGWNGAAYELSTTSVPIDGIYERAIVFGEVYRDSSGVLDPDGTLDPDARTVTVTITRVSDGRVLGEAASLLHNSYE